MKKLMTLAMTVAIYLLSAQMMYAQQRMMEGNVPEVEILGHFDSGSTTLAEKLGQIKGINSVYVSKAMMGMAGSMGGKIPSSMAGKLEKINIFNTEDAAKSKELRSTAEKFMKENNYEVMMEVNDEGDDYMCIRMKELRKDCKEIGRENLAVSLGERLRAFFLCFVLPVILGLLTRRKGVR